MLDLVASRDHVQRGLSEGICQANHGIEAAIRRMKKGVRVLFYSPREKFGEDERCRKFTATGEIQDALIIRSVNLAPR